MHSYDYGVRNDQWRAGICGARENEHTAHTRYGSCTVGDTRDALPQISLVTGHCRSVISAQLFWALNLSVQYGAQCQHPFFQLLQLSIELPLYVAYHTSLQCPRLLTETSREGTTQACDDDELCVTRRFDPLVARGI